MKYFTTLIVLGIIQQSSYTHGLFKFTNLVCKVLDPDFCNFEYCYIKAVNRSFKYISIKMNLYKLPVTNANVRLAIQKKANGYKPFLYNFTFDVCQFLKSKNNPLIGYFYSFIEKHSNANHTCPYNHDLIVDKLSTTYIDNLVTNKLPVPDGEYAFRTSWSSFNKVRATLDVFVKIGN